MAKEDRDKDKDRGDVVSVPTSKAKQQDRFSGGVPLQYGLWGHYMSQGCSHLCFFFGIVAVLWDEQAYFYECKIDGTLIHEDYILKGAEFGVLVVGERFFELMCAINVCMLACMVYFCVIFAC